MAPADTTAGRTGEYAPGIRLGKPVPPGRSVYDEENFISHSRGILTWLVTLDHKRIGLMYLISVLSAFLLGGLAALLVRYELFTADSSYSLLQWPVAWGWVGQGKMLEDLYNKTFTLHGAIMVFLFIVPSIPASLGNFLLPVMLGAKDVAFPRLNLMSYYLWVGGAVFFISSLIFGGVETGWTFYTPYSTTTDGGVVLATLGVFVLGFSSIFTGLNFIVTINTMRPPGMTWFRMPLFLWSLYATSIIQVLATPVIGITSMLLIAERVLRIGIFDPTLGGDPVLFQHFFWFYSHPVVYIMILPAMGIISEVMAVYSRKHIFGYRFIAYSSIALALLGFLVWGHHMFVSGQSPMSVIIFSTLTFGVSVPSAIKVFNWLATMYRGNIVLSTGMLHGLSFIFNFTIGGLTGLFLGSLATDIYYHDTYFVVAHFHYVMMGGTMIAFLAGLFHWWPKMTGKMYSEFWGRIGAFIVFFGFNLTFFPQFLLGNHGMPRRYANYLPEYAFLHQMSTVGAFVLGAGLFLSWGVLMHSLVRGRRAAANPWGGVTLEWMCTSPPPHDNFAVAPTVGNPYDFEQVEYDPEHRGFVPVRKPAPQRVAEPQPTLVPSAEKADA